MSSRGSLRFCGLFSFAEDALAFLAPTLFAVAVCVYLSWAGQLEQPLSKLGWFFAVVFVDVAHVYATIYRVYANPRELRRRWRLYLAVPLLAYAGSWLLYRHDGLSFWRALAYLAVFHFVRQQVGWVALCGRKESHFSVWDRRLDAAAVYAGTLYPIFYWHAHLPRRFVWFVEGDFFLPMPPMLLQAARFLFLLIGALWLMRQAQRVVVFRSLNLTRVLIMGMTWLSYYLGIVFFHSDIAFTLTNVLPHGIPYFVLLYRYRTSEQAAQLAAAPNGSRGGRVFSPPWLAPILFYVPLACLAFVEEGLWDRFVWHEHGGFFLGADVFVSDAALAFLVPLLALPQATHYLLDAWIWKVGPQNPGLREYLRL